MTACNDDDKLAMLSPRQLSSTLSLFDYHRPTSLHSRIINCFDLSTGSNYYLLHHLNIKHKHCASRCNCLFLAILSNASLISHLPKIFFSTCAASLTKKNLGDANFTPNPLAKLELKMSLPNELEAALRQITSPDTSGIKAATEQLQNVYYKKPESLPALIHILQTNPELHLKQLAGVEARKLVGVHWDATNDATKTQIKTSLLESTIKEPNALVRHTSSRVIAAVAVIEVEEDKWNDLMPILHRICTSNVAAEREVGVYLLYSLLEAEIENILSNPADLLNLFAHTIKDPESLQVRVTTVLSLGIIAEHTESEGSSDPLVVKFRELIPDMVNVLRATIEASDDKSSSQIFEVFTSLLTCDPTLTSKHFSELITLMADNIAADMSLDTEYRSPALQFLITALRFRKSKVAQQADFLVKKAAQIAVAECQMKAEEGEDDDEEDDSDFSESPLTLCMELLSFLSSNLSPTQVMVPLLTEVFPQFVRNPDPSFRRVAFGSIAATVEGAPDFVLGYLDDILPVVIDGLKDSNVLVKNAALRALENLATELGEEVSDSHEIILPLIFDIWANIPGIKIAASCCGALDAILENIDGETMANKYLDEIATRLLQTFQNTQDPALQTSIVTAIGSAAISSGKAYTPYFERTLATLGPHIVLEGEPPVMTLSAMCLDVIGQLASAVGAQAFVPHVESLVSLAVKALQGDESKLHDSALILLGVFAKVYEEEFAPFLPSVMPIVFGILKTDEYADSALPENIDELVNVGGDEQEAFEEAMMKNEQVNSAMAIEKEVALHALGEFISHTKAKFAPYIPEATKILKGEIHEHYYGGIRKGVNNSLWSIFCTWYKLANLPDWTPSFPANTSGLNAEQTEIVTLGNEIREISLNVLTVEDDADVAITILCNLEEGMKLAGPLILGNEEALAQFVEQTQMILQKEHMCQVEDFELDEQDAEKENDAFGGEASEADEVLLDYAIDCIVQIAKCVGPVAGQLMQSYLDIFEKMAKSKSSSDSSLAIGGFAEMTMALKEQVTPLTKQFLQLFMTALGDRNLSVRSSAAYGIGLVCFFSDDTAFVRAAYNEILAKMQKLLAKADKARRKHGEDDENSSRGLANACGAVARMCSRHPDIIPLQAVVQVLTERLPIADGYEENIPIFNLIVDLFASGNEVVIAQKAKFAKILEQVLTEQDNVERLNAAKSVGAAPDVLPIEDKELKGKMQVLLQQLM